MSEQDNKGLEAELGVVSDQLVRTERVASRVARFEHDDGLHGDGTVPFSHFINETSYLKGEILRLREKLRQTTGRPDSEIYADTKYWAPEPSVEEVAVEM